MKIYDARVKETVAAFVDALPEPQFYSDDWWDNIVFQQPESRFLNDFRMTKARFNDVCTLFFALV